MFRVVKIFTVIHLVHGVAMAQMQKATLPEQDLLQRPQYFNLYRDSLQQMPHLLQYNNLLDQALQELMRAFLHNKWEHPTEAQLFLHKQEEIETARQITETGHHQDEQIELHYIPQDQNNKSVDKRHQPTDSNGFKQNANLKMDIDNKKKFLREKIRQFLQSREMQQLRPQSDDERRKQEKIVAKIRQLLNEQNQPVLPQPPPPMIEMQDLVVQQKEPQPINQNESYAGIKNEPPQEKYFQSDQLYANKNPHNQPQEQNIKNYHLAENPQSQQPAQKLFTGMQNSNIMGNKYYPRNEEQIMPQPGDEDVTQQPGDEDVTQQPGDEDVTQQPDIEELHYVVQQLQKTLQNPKAWQSQMSPSVPQAKWLQQQMKKQIALGHVQADIEKKLRAPQQNEGKGESNQSEPFSPPPMMSNPSQSKPEANLNVMDIMKSKDVLQDQPLQSSISSTQSMPMANEHFGGSMNNFAAPGTMMMQILNNMQQQTMMANSNPNPLKPQNNMNQLDMTKNLNMPPNTRLQTAMWPQMANTQEQSGGNANNIGSPIVEMMQIADNNGWPQSPHLTLSPPLSQTNAPSWTYPYYPMQHLVPGISVMTMTQAENNSQQQSIPGGVKVSPVMSMQNLTDQNQNCPNAEGCMSMSANNDTKEGMEETGRLKPRAFFNLTPVSVIIAIIQNFLALEVYEDVKLSGIAIENAERNIFLISSNINVLSAFTDHLLFLRRRLEYLPVQFGAHYRILSQLRAKISRMGALQYETTRAINNIKVDLNSRRKEALTNKSQLLTNGLINIILLIINVIQIFSEDESLSYHALLFQAVVTAVFGGILIANVTFFFFLGGFLTSFDGILESVAEFELQLESLTAHFHDTLDRVDFAFETPHFANPGFNQGFGPNVKNVSFSNSGAITGAVNLGGFDASGFNFGGFNLGNLFRPAAGRLGLPADSSFNEPADFSLNQPEVFSGNEPTDFSGNEPAAARLGLPADSSVNEPKGFSRNEATSFSRNKPTGFSTDTEISHQEINPFPKTTQPPKSFNPPLTTIDPPGRTSNLAPSVPSSSTIIKKANTENVNLSHKFPLLKSIRDKLNSKIYLSKWL